MKKFLFAIIGVTLLLNGPLAIAQEAVLDPVDETVPAENVVITGPQEIAVGRTVVLDGSLSRVAGTDPQYQWFIGDSKQPISRTVEAVYTPEKTGTITFRFVVSAVVNGKRTDIETSHTVTVYSRKIVMIADASVPDDKIEIHRKAAAEAGVFLRVLKTTESTTPIAAEESLVMLVSEQKEAIAGANSVVIWTEGVTGLQALMRALQDDEDLMSGIRNQTIVLITNRGLGTLARIARGPYTVLRPEQIILTRAEAINPLLTAESTEKFISEIDARDVGFERLDQSTAGLRPWNVLSWLVDGMLTRGVPSQTVILLLVLPIIATILAFLKQVIGVTTFGLYMPSIIALSFLALGWVTGIVFLLFILITTYATRSLTRKWRLLYIPKVAIILTAVSIALLVLMGISALVDFTFSRETIFILLIMSTLTESFLSLKTEEGWYSAVLGVAETVLAAMLCVFIVQWAVFQAIILAYPELILLTILVNAILGKWTGLRLVEYIRFREVFKHLQEEE